MENFGAKNEIAKLKAEMFQEKKEHAKTKEEFHKTGRYMQ